MTHYGLFGGVPATSDPKALASIAGYGRGLRKAPLEGASPLWAIAPVETGDGVVLDRPISWTDMEHDVAWAAAMLQQFGLKRGDFCLYSLFYAQSALFWPWLKAGFDRGARSATGMPTSWDAYRVEAYLRRFQLALVFGIAPETLDGLEAAGHDIGVIYGSARRLAALPGAWERLAAKGLSASRITLFGPILAVDHCDGAGGRFDSSRWALESREGQIVLSSRGDHAGLLDRIPTGVEGAIRIIDGQPRFFGKQA